MPSMSGFFYICEYLNITPKDFFDTELSSPLLVKELYDELGKLSPSKAEHILQIIKDINN